MGASGAVVTTENQACGLRGLFPELPILVRPNGFPTVNHDGSSHVLRTERRSESVLRIAHFGNVSSARLDVVPFLVSLARAGVWERVELHVFGSDWTGTLRDARDVTVVFHESRPWPEIVREARGYDVAMVIGNRDPQQLPSKAIVYLQLPIPRLAVVQDLQTDALAEYVADKKGWIALRADTGDAAARIDRHVSRTWTTDDLAAPPTESWEQVSESVARFVWHVLAPHVLADAAIAR